MVRDAGEPNCNADHLAAKFRDELMPLRARLCKRQSPIVGIGRVSHQHTCSSLELTHRRRLPAVLARGVSYHRIVCQHDRLLVAKIVLARMRVKLQGWHTRLSCVKRQVNFLLCQVCYAVLCSATCAVLCCVVSVGADADGAAAVGRPGGRSLD
jgi:hypothetical protein